jgi:hypothetical protein
MKLTLKNLLIVALITLAAFTDGTAARSRLRSRFTPYTVTWRVTDYDAAGNATFRYNETRVTDSGGRWHDLKKHADGHREEAFAEPGRGAFAVHQDKLMFYSNAPMEPPGVTMETLRASKQFVREDVVAGIPVAVLRVTNDAYPDSALEVYVAPSLNGDALKTIITDKYSVRVLEPVALTKGEPDPAALSHPEKPADRSHYERLHGGL